MIDFDKEMTELTLLILDNFSGHKLFEDTESKVKYVKIWSLPPNTTLCS